MLDWTLRTVRPAIGLALAFAGCLDRNPAGAEANDVGAVDGTDSVVDASIGPGASAGGEGEGEGSDDIAEQACEPGVDRGTEGCPCYPNETCNDGYACEAGRCVVPACVPGSEGCACYASGSCEAEYECRAGVCVRQIGEPDCPPECGAYEFMGEVFDCTDLDRCEGSTDPFAKRLAWLPVLLGPVPRGNGMPPQVPE